VPDDDHLAELAALEDDGPPRAAAVVVDTPWTSLPLVGHREPHDLPPEQLAAHLRTSRSSALSTAKAVARYGLDDDGLDLRELLEGVDATKPQVVGGHVEDDADVAAVEAEPFAQDAAARDLEDGEVDPRVLQHHPRRLRPGRVGADDEPLVDDDAVGRRHADLCGPCP
jgi:hypothetical protein